jgi:hypothetical protein
MQWKRRHFVGSMLFVVAVGSAGLATAVSNARGQRASRASRLTSFPTIAWYNEEGELIERVPEPGVLAIVSSRCGHCRKALVSLAKGQVRERSAALTIIVVDSLKPMRAFVDSIRLHASLMQLRNADSEELKTLGVRAVPTIYWIGLRGRILDAQIGELTPVEAQLWMQRAMRPVTPNSE